MDHAYAQTFSKINSKEKHTQCMSDRLAFYIFVKQRQKGTDLVRLGHGSQRSGLVFYVSSVSFSTQAAHDRATGNAVQNPCFPVVIRTGHHFSSTCRHQPCLALGGRFCYDMAAPAFIATVLRFVAPVAVKRYALFTSRRRCRFDDSRSSTGSRRPGKRRSLQAASLARHRKVLRLAVSIDDRFQRPVARQHGQNSDRGRRVDRDD